MMIRHFLILGTALALAATAHAESMRVEVRTAAGEVVAAVDLIDGDVDAQAPGVKLGSRRKGDKRKYTQGGSDIAEVKLGDEGFKVKAPDGTLRWKVKVKGDKIKLGRDEAMTDDFELRAYADHVKLKQGEKELARVTVDLGKNALKLERDGAATEYTVASPRVTVGFAVLALPASDVDRAILLSELVALGR